MLALLGPFKAMLDGQPITGFTYEKVKALLAYLVIEAEHPHHRDTLATMLWRDQNNQSARSNLRKALAILRQVLGDRDTTSPFLLATRNTIQFNPISDYTLDVAKFTAHLSASAAHQHLVGELCSDCVLQMEQAVALYRGQLLVELSLFDSEVFKEWAMLTRERLHQQAIDACTNLSAYFEHQHYWDQAQRYAQRQLELEPWNEPAHQCLIRVLGHSGKRNAALKQFDRCRQVLADELEVEPEPTTTALYQQLRTSSFNPLPRWLGDKVSENCVAVSEPQETVCEIKLSGAEHVLRETSDAPLPPNLELIGEALSINSHTDGESEASYPHALKDKRITDVENTPSIAVADQPETGNVLVFPSDIDCSWIPNPQNAAPSQDEVPGKSGQYLSIQCWRNRRKMIEKVYTFWIKGVLENSLHNAVLMDLGLEERLDAVVQPWNFVVQSPAFPEQSLPLGYKPIDVYEKLRGALLILGAPGAGKTTLLLDLARLLLTRAEQDICHPIPVVFNLSSWAAQSCPLDNWLVDELHVRYQVPKEIGQEWIMGSQVLPLLDGLDEVVIAQREACVTSINEFRAKYWLLDIVVCSRVTDYYALARRLQFQGAIEIQPLTPEQVDAYLIGLGDKLVTVRTALQQYSALREIADTPLIVNIIVLAYQAQAIDNRQSKLSPEDWRSHLFTTYTQQMFARRGADSRYTTHQLIAWLAWLARALTQRDQTLFLIEHLQPDWLPFGTQQRFVAISKMVAVALLVGLVGGLGVGIHEGIATGWADGVWPWLLRGLMGMMNGLAVGFVAAAIAAVIALVIALVHEEPAQVTLDSQKWRSIWHAVRLGLAAGLGQGLAVGLMLGPILGIGDAIVSSLGVGIAAWHFLCPGRITLVEVISWSWSRVWLGVVPGATLGLVFGLVYGFANGFIYGWIVFPAVWAIALVGFGLTGNEIEMKTIPNQNIHRSAHSALRIAIAMGLPFGLANGVGYGLAVGWAGGIGNGISAGMVGSITFWLMCGGLACIQHVVVRLLLCRNGATPWNYARFLDYATERIFLRRVGGGYIFIHRLLLEYFAAVDVSTFNCNQILPSQILED